MNDTRSSRQFVGRFCFWTCCTTAGLFLSFFPVAVHANFDVKKMDLYEAIGKMRKLSNRGECFSFAFMTFSATKRKSHGISEVRRARLAPQNRDDNHPWKDYLLYFVDLDTNETKRCYQPLLMEFNGEKLELN